MGLIESFYYSRGIYYSCMCVYAIMYAYVWVCVCLFVCMGVCVYVYVLQILQIPQNTLNWTIKKISKGIP